MVTLGIDHWLTHLLNIVAIVKRILVSLLLAPAPLLVESKRFLTPATGAADIIDCLLLETYTHIVTLRFTKVPLVFGQNWDINRRI